MSFSSKEIWKEFSKNTLGIAGMIILAGLVILSIIALATFSTQDFQNWNDPANWLSYPKAASPAWINYFSAHKVSEHLILLPQSVNQKSGELYTVTDYFSVNYDYDSVPSDFIYQYAAKYYGSPLLKMSVIRPDGVKLDLFSTSLPGSDIQTAYSGMIFSTDDDVKKNVKYGLTKLSSYDAANENIIFSNLDKNSVLKGHYVFQIVVYNIGSKPTLTESKLILGGKVYGLMGTDELRRDLAMGLLWGTPLALFIGITVAVGSVLFGLLYGIYAGFKGNLVDETMMRFNDVIYAMPVLPLLIILAVTIGNSIFLIVGFLVVFGWVGIAKVSRSMAIQIKTLPYVEASKLMGQKDSRIIFKHILPQLLPYAFASIAISVPAAITTEAGLSFLGLGDSTFPTWGQILHDASSYNAAARGMWWWVLPPGIMIAITGLAFVFMGHAMDVIANPRLRR